MKVRAQHSSRKSSHCLRRQSAGRMEAEIEEERPEPSSPQPKGGSPTVDQPQPKAQAPAPASPENRGQEGIPAEKGDCSGPSQPKALWKPIPPLQPQRGAAHATREQSCQTDEGLESNQDSCAHAPEPGPSWETSERSVEEVSDSSRHASEEEAESTESSSDESGEQAESERSTESEQTEEEGETEGESCIEPGDPPLFQKPLMTSKSGIQQIIECFRSGTSDLKHMLLREVDTIFECKLCRSLFRGLPNLITHREYYCLTQMPEPDADDRQSTPAVKELLDAIYPKKEQPDQVVRLEPIQTSTKAVFQYLTTEEELSRQDPVSWGCDEAEDEEQSQPETHSDKQALGFTAIAQKPEKEVAEEGEVKDEAPQAEEDSSNSGVEDVTISCCLCGKDFNSRRSIRRHCRKMHQTKLEELRKFTETRTVPFSLLSVVKGRPKTISSPVGKSCPVCFKNFATKANVRRHFDEVHRGLRRDLITPDIATRPGQPLSLEDTPPRKGTNASPTQGTNQKSATQNSKGATQNQAKTTNQPRAQNQAKSQKPASSQQTYNLASCRCLRCKKTYSSQVMLKRHMRIVHKIFVLKNGRGAAAAASTAASTTPPPPRATSNSVHVKEEATETSDDEDEDDPRSSSASSPSTGSERDLYANKDGTQVKAEESSPGSPTAVAAARDCATTGGKAKVPRLSVGFDFKQLFCKLCKRQFSSRQNLTKHIELHTDGNDIFIKFYRCPLCRYESRRKRDVLRHVTVVHKKSSAYLAKIMPKLESRAVKRSAEVVLKNTAKRPLGVNGRHTPPSPPRPCPPSPPVTRKQDQLHATAAGSSTRRQLDMSSASPLSPSPPVTRKQDKLQSHQQRPISPPLTRRSEKHALQQDSTSSSSQSAQAQSTDAPSESGSTGSTSTEVKVTKNFSLHACDQCGRAFAKKFFLDSHKRSHRNAAAAAAAAEGLGSADNRRKGVNTRSKSLLW